MTNYTPLHDALNLLAGRDPDFASERNAIGFNGTDGGTGHRLARLPLADWSPADTWAAWRMLRKYHGQVGEWVLSMPEPPKPASMSTIGINGNGLFYAAFEYNAALVEIVKANIPANRRYVGESRRWEIQPTPANLAGILRLIANHGFIATDAAEAEIARQMTTAPATSAPLAPTAAPAPPAKTKTLDLRGADFILRFPYNPNDSSTLDAVRALPKRKFNDDNPADKHWRAAALALNLPGLLKLAADYNFTVTPAAQARLTELADTTSANLASARDLNATSDLVIAGLGKTLRPFQMTAVEYALRNKHIFMADEMGCIAGDALLNVNRAGKGFAVALADAYLRIHGISGNKHHNWDATIPTYCRAMCDGELHQHRVVDIIAKDRRAVVRLTLASGKTLTLTPDHEVARPNDAWTRADALQPGDEVLTNGTPVCPGCGTTEDLIAYPYAKFVGYCRTCMYRQQRAKPTYKTGKFVDADGYVRVTGQYDHPRAGRGHFVYEHILVLEAKLGRPLADDEFTHHIDGNRANNAPENLQVVTASEHHVLHHRYNNLNGGTGGKGGSIQFIPKLDTVVSVEPAGEAEVYDVVMADPHRNFVANGIIVHNCGKTIEALATIQAANAYPCLIICPASLKLNWAREAAAWLPGHTVAVVKGRSNHVPDADIVVANYDILSAEWGKATIKGRERKVATLTATGAALAGRNFRTLICDESHYLKSPASDTLRSAAVKQIAKGREYILFLTGTPIMNRPKELINQLDTLGRLDEFGGFWKFATRYSNYHQGQWGGVWDEWQSTSERNARLAELNDLLRKTTMIRRLKSEVLKELPPKQWATVTLPLTNRKEYDAAADDICAWLAANVSQKAASAAELAEHLVRIERLKQLAVEGKLAGLREWVTDFLESGEKLVLFGWHVAVVEGLAREFGCAAITGSTSLADRQKAVDAFQTDPACKLLVANIQAGGVGITLHAASNIAFCEFPWNPAQKAQAEDRIHRMGQTAEAVTIWDIVGADSIDEDIVALIAAKQDVITQAVDGTATDAADVNLLQELIKRLLAQRGQPKH